MNTYYFNQSEKGFTLMELMIVIAIISILSSIAIPAYRGYIQKAALTDVLQTLSPYRTAIELCGYNRPYSQCGADYENLPSVFNSRYLSEIKIKEGVISAIGKGQLSTLTIDLIPEVSSIYNSHSWKITCTSSNPSLQKKCLNIFKAS